MIDDGQEPFNKKLHRLCITDLPRKLSIAGSAAINNPTLGTKSFGGWLTANIAWSTNSGHDTCT